MIVSVMKENLNEVVARNFRVMLAERQIKKSDIHNKTGISRNTITNVSSGKTKMIMSFLNKKI